jgi:hypothetical protein
MAGAAMSVVLVALVFGCQARIRYLQAAAVAEAEAELGLYLERIREGDFHGAYLQLCIDVTADYGPAEHAEYLRTQPKLETFEILDGSDTQTGIDGTYVLFRTRLTYANGRTVQTVFAVGRETGGPKVCDSPGWRTDLTIAR